MFGGSRVQSAVCPIKKNFSFNVIIIIIILSIIFSAIFAFV